eukprot:jgi/Ulvmu1/9581/UM054_0011.1
MPSDLEESVALGIHEMRPPCDNSAWACLRLGMRESTVDAWSRIHVQPHVIWAWNMGSGLATAVWFPAVALAGFPWFMARAHIPALVWAFTTSLHVIGMGYIGPGFALTKSAKACNAFGVLSMVYLLTASFVGPISFTPFQNRLVNTICTGMGLLLVYIYTSTGGTAAEHPADPYPTILAPLTNSAFSTLRSLDAYTDLGLVRLLWDKGPDCIWFGRQTSCHRFRVMAVAAGTCALIQIASSFAIVLVGGQGMMYGQDARRPRLSLAFRVVALLSELCGLCIALLNVLSDRGPGSDVAFILVSAGTSLVSFCVTCIGSSSVWKSVQRATGRISGHMCLPSWRRVQPSPSGLAPPEEGGTTPCVIEDVRDKDTPAHG